MSIRVPICYTHSNDPCYNNNSYSYNGNVYIAPNGSNIVPPSGNAILTSIPGVEYSEGVYGNSKFDLNARPQRLIQESARDDSSSDESNKSPSRMAEKDRRRDMKKA